jgi:hypothetical protein
MDDTELQIVTTLLSGIHLTLDRQITSFSACNEVQQITVIVPSARPQTLLKFPDPRLYRIQIDPTACVSRSPSSWNRKEKANFGSHFVEAPAQPGACSS